MLNTLFASRRRYSVEELVADFKAGRTPPKPTRGKKPVDHTGKRFGRLVVIGYVGRRPVGKSRPGCCISLWFCKCDCGADTVVASSALVCGDTLSCGCFGREAITKSGGWNVKPTGESALNQLFSAYQRSAKARGYTFQLPKDVFKDLTSSPCFYCGCKPLTAAPRAIGTNGDYMCNGVDRVDNSLGYILGNVRPCCKQCNVAKGVLSENDFFDWVNRVHSHLHGETPR